MEKKQSDASDVLIDKSKCVVCSGEGKYLYEGEPSCGSVKCDTSTIDMSGIGDEPKKRSARGGPEGMRIASAFLDRRVKLLPCQRERIHQMHHNEGFGVRHLSRIFNVNKRLIQFICFPERQKKNLELRQARGGSSQYYDRVKHREAMSEHRSYKKQIFERRKIETNGPDSTSLTSSL